MSPTEEKIRDMDDRLRVVEHGMATMKQEQKATHELASSIKGDTAEIVAMFKGGKVFGELIKWSVYIGAPLYAFVTWIKGGGR